MGKIKHMASVSWKDICAKPNIEQLISNIL